MTYNVFLWVRIQPHSFTQIKYHDMTGRQSDRICKKKTISRSACYGLLTHNNKILVMTRITNHPQTKLNNIKLLERPYPECLKALNPLTRPRTLLRVVYSAPQTPSWLGGGSSQLPLSVPRAEGYRPFGFRIVVLWASSYWYPLVVSHALVNSGHYEWRVWKFALNFQTGAVGPCLGVQYAPHVASQPGIPTRWIPSPHSAIS